MHGGSRPATLLDREVESAPPRPAAVAGCFVAATLAALALLAPAALAADHHQKAKAAKIALLSPKPGARTGAGTIEVRVRSSTTADFFARLAGHDVSGRFHRRGGVLEATLRRGRDFRLGDNQLLIATGRGAARRAKTFEFVARRRAKRLLTVSEQLRRGAATPLRVRVRVSHSISRLSLTLNHRRVRLGPIDGRRSWSVALGADDGLRFGRNTLTVEAERTGSGRFDRERHRFSLDRSAPLAGAGPDRVTHTGRSVVLDASATRSGHPGSALLYRWKIVQKPQGSRARIVNSTGRLARLLPDLPGSYRVRLVAARVSPATKAADAKAEASAATAPPPSEPTCLQPVSASASSAEPSQPLTPLESPTCVTPTGDTTTPPLPLEARGAVGADEVEVSSLATENPMGWAIETIAADGSIRIGPYTYPKVSGFAHLLVLNQQSLKPESGKWGSGEQTISLAKASKLEESVEKTSNRQIVVISGMGEPQSGAPKAAQEALEKAVSALGGQAPEASELAGIVESGEWSVVGSRGEPGRTFTNLYGLGQQPPSESAIGSLPGSINGYLQDVLVHAFSYVSSEFIPIDTRAAGSSNTVSVFELGEVTATSETIGNGSLGLHIAVFSADSPSGKPALLNDSTFVIDNPFVSTNQAGVKAAAEDLQYWREQENDVLIVMQTFGEEAITPSTAPWASPYWVNDNLIKPGSRGLFEWDNQPYVSAKHEPEVEGLLDEMWNPGYPTVAGQVGDLTGMAGHDLVANLAAGNPQIEVSRLTVVALNHAQNPEENYVRGYAADANGTPEGRLVGTLVRNQEAGWTVQSGQPSGSFSPSNVWEIAFQSPTPWEMSESAEDKAAMANIARRIWPGEGVTDVREQYARLPKGWSGFGERLRELDYETTNAYTESTFNSLRKQLGIEMRDVRLVREAIGTWQETFAKTGTDGQVSVSELSSRIVAEAVKQAKLNERKEAEISPEKIISESLYTAADLLGFPEANETLKLAETVGVLAGGFGLAEAANPEAPEEAEEGANAEEIRATAGKLGGALQKHFEGTSEMLGHLGTILVSDWGKLQKAAGAGGTWMLGEDAQKLVRQSLAVEANQELYEALLPLAYEQWVVSPYQTVSNGTGPQPPGHSYTCKEYRPAYESEGYRHPFRDEPEGALSTSVYRPFDEPGASTSPAQRYTTAYTLRALKSQANKMTVKRIDYFENQQAVTVTHDGSSPPSSLIDHLFVAVNPGEKYPNFPNDLGINKAEFFANFGEGPTTWKRMICAQE